MSDPVLDDGNVLYHAEGWMLHLKKHASDAYLGHCANCDRDDIPVYFDGETSVCLDIWACATRSALANAHRLLRMAA